MIVKVKKRVKDVKLIEAVRYNGDNIQEIEDFALSVRTLLAADENNKPVIEVNGLLTLMPGFWLLRFLQEDGSHEYQMRYPEDFVMEYEEIFEQRISKPNLGPSNLRDEEAVYNDFCADFVRGLRMAIPLKDPTANGGIYYRVDLPYIITDEHVDRFMADATADGWNGVGVSQNLGAKTMCITVEPKSF